MRVRGRWGLLAAVAFLWLPGCAQVEHSQQIAQPVGRTITVPVGGAIATITKDKDLPNVFGRADLYGRKVNEGVTKIIYKGRGNDGSAQVEQIDVDVRSDASAMTNTSTSLVLRPTTEVFSVPKGKTLTLASGQTIEFLNIESHQVSYRIVEPPARSGN